ncbi:MAG: SPOR domain-containing protein [Pseudomonadota bacterium]
MDRVLLKRLLGAGVIVALAVIVLPFFLQGEGYKAALRTDIPARPQPPQPLDTASREPPAEVRELMEPPPPLPMAQAPAPRNEPAKEAVDAGAAKPAPKPAAPPAPSEVKPASKPAPTPQAPQAPAAKPAPEASKPEVVPNAAVKPAAPPAQPPLAAAKPQAGGVWMIQLGSFSAEANAQQLRGQVQRVGIPCLIEPLDIEGRKVWRVRAGPFASQAEADAALKRLQGGLKLGGMVMQVR